MSFLTQGVQAVSKVITEQPSLNHSNNPESSSSGGGLLPAVERAIQRLGQVNQEDITFTDGVQPSAPPEAHPTISVLDAPPSYDTIFPEVYESNIAKVFQSNQWQSILINDKRIFQNLDKQQIKQLDDTISDTDVNPYTIKVAQEVADDVKCNDVAEFIRILEFVKMYLKMQKEKQVTGAQQQNTAINATPMDNLQNGSGVQAQQPQHQRGPDPIVDPFCCWLCLDGLPPTHGNSGPFCCFCCYPCCNNGSESVVDGGTAANDGNCDCDCSCDDCGECDCADCDCNCGDCGF